MAASAARDRSVQCRVGSLGARTVFDELLAKLPAAQNSKVKEAVWKIRGNDDQSGIINPLLDSYGAYRAAQATLEIAALVADIAAELERRKRDERVVTFDDLLILAKRLLRDHPEVALRYRRTLGALLVDEYQDTDPIQDGVVRLLTEHGAPAPELFVVGDEKAIDLSLPRRRRHGLQPAARAARDPAAAVAREPPLASGDRRFRQRGERALDAARRAIQTTSRTG